MKTLLRILVMGVLAISLWFGISRSVIAAALEQLPDTNFVKADNSKIDLNNANVNAFRRLPGMYPTLAKLIIKNAPYTNLEDVYKIANLTDRQKERLQEYIGEFTLKRPDNSMQRERINNANYRL